MATTKKQARQLRAAKRLDKQLASGVKTTTQLDFAGIKKSLTDRLSESDIDRIKKERSVLKERIGY